MGRQTETLVPVPLGQICRIADEFQRAGRLDEAHGLVARVLAVRPRDPEALHISGLIAFRRGCFVEAAELIEAAVRQGIDTPLYYRNLCAVLERLGRYDAALDAGRRAVMLAPCDAHSYHNLTLVHYRRLELDQSIACARTAIALDPAMPGPHFALAEALLLKGEMAEGWEEYEWRFRIQGGVETIPPINLPLWDGASLPGGRVLLVADQGFGDAVQFCRYLPWAVERYGITALACSAELVSLLSDSFPDMRCQTQVRNVAPDMVWYPLSGLPRLHGTRLETIPSAASYLRATPARTLAWKARLEALAPASGRRVGIAWAGRPTHMNDSNRSASLDVLAPVAALPGITLVSLQKGQPAGQVGGYFGAAPLLNLGPELADFADTAALIATLDLVIAVDTSVAHLAAALGCPVWLLLPWSPDWRWMLDRSDTPWYPSMRLFRQPQPGDWASIVRTVAEELRQNIVWSR